MKKLGFFLAVAVFGVVLAACTKTPETTELMIEDDAMVLEEGTMLEGEALVEDDAMVGGDAMVEGEEAMDGEDKMMKDDEYSDTMEKDGDYMEK